MYTHLLVHPIFWEKIIKKLSKTPICIKMFHFIQVSITLVIGHCIFMCAFHCCIQWTTNGNQKEVPSANVYQMPTVN